jgi:hypothetical protein
MAPCAALSVAEENPPRDHSSLVCKVPVVLLVLQCEASSTADGLKPKPEAIIGIVVLVCVVSEPAA